MTNPNVTIRHAKHAVNLLIGGACRAIEAEFDSADEAEAQQQVVSLFDEVHDTLMGWHVIPSLAYKADRLVTEMLNMTGDDNCPDVVRELIGKFDLYP